MSSLLRSTLNTRFLPVGDRRFVRSDAPLNLTNDEVCWLLENGITTLVDLRSTEETLLRPCPLSLHPAFRYHHLPVTGGGNTPRSRAHLHETYRNMVDGRMARILDVILAAPKGVLYFCTAGKDRTGVVSALLLKKLGADEETIVQDYMRSKENLMDMLLSYAKSHPEVDPDIIIPREENILQLMHELKKLDDTRFIDTASGWFRGCESDVNSPHVYFRPFRFKGHKKPTILSEFGGYVKKEEGHLFNKNASYGYKYFSDSESYIQALEKLYNTEGVPTPFKGVGIILVAASIMALSFMGFTGMFQ